MKKLLTIFIAILMVTFLSGCCTSHEFAQANCIPPATCSKCGKAEGDALGHQWAEANCLTPKTCERCFQTQGEATGHNWIDANCTKAKVCTSCDLTEGNPLGHAWSDATCTLPKTCSVCLEVEGEALGHTVSAFSIVQESTCTVEGEESGICDICSETITNKLSLIEHTSSEWITTVSPTKLSDGIRVKKCTVCEKQLEEEKYSLSAEELKQLYINQCNYISYDSLSRTPNEYKGEFIRFSGKVVQVCSEAKSALYYSTYRVATSGSYDNVVYIYVDNYDWDTRILEDDHITFYGTFDGLYSYKTVMGATLTIPSIKVEYVDY